MTDEPQRCPVCNGYPREGGESLSISRQACDWCGLYGPWRGSKELAIAVWNRLAYLPEDWRETIREAVELVWAYEDLSDPEEYPVSDKLRALLGESDD